MTAIPQKQVLFDINALKPQWSHPYFDNNKIKPHYSKQELEAFAYDYYLRFMPFFKHQAEGNLGPGVVIEFSTRMRQKLGLASLFLRNIRINQLYFARDPRLLPYCLFHELVHLWLYDCLLDPGHTRKFYEKMFEFEQTGLPKDPDVHIHSRLSSEAKFVYVCKNCRNRWYVNDAQTDRLSCGYCEERFGQLTFPERFENIHSELRIKLANFF
jgi:predicted SprT family Zn-dependent metalloprotease